MDNDELFKHIIAEVKDIKKEMVELKIVSTKQEENLKEHMRRSDTLEKLYSTLSSELQPIKTHVKHVEGALKLMGLIGMGVGILAGLVKIIEFFS